MKIFFGFAGKKVEKVAKEFIKKYGKERLREVAKIHFKTTNKILKTESE